MCDTEFPQQVPRVTTEFSIQQRHLSNIDVHMSPFPALVIIYALNTGPIQAQHSQYYVMSEQQTHKRRERCVEARTTLTQRIVNQSQSLVLTMRDETPVRENIEDVGGFHGKTEGEFVVETGIAGLDEEEKGK